MTDYVYSLKYLFTRGIQKVRVSQYWSHGGASVFNGESSIFSSYLQKSEYRKTKEEAIKMAENIKIKKIQYLKKKLEEIEKLEFKIDE